MYTLTPEEARDIGQALVNAADQGEEIALRVRLNEQPSSHRYQRA